MVLLDEWHVQLLVDPLIPERGLAAMTELLESEIEMFVEDMKGRLADAMRDSSVMCASSDERPRATSHPGQYAMPTLRPLSTTTPKLR